LIVYAVSHVPVLAPASFPAPYMEDELVLIFHKVLRAPFWDSTYSLLVIFFIFRPGQGEPLQDVDLIFPFRLRQSKLMLGRSAYESGKKRAGMLQGGRQLGHAGIDMGRITVVGNEQQAGGQVEAEYLVQGELDVVQVPAFIDIKPVSVLDQRDDAGKIVDTPSRGGSVNAHLFRYFRPLEA